MAFLKEAAEPLLRCYPWSGLAPSCPCFIGFSAARFTYTKSISSNTLLGSEGARQNVVFQCSIFFLRDPHGPLLHVETEHLNV